MVDSWGPTDTFSYAMGGVSPADDIHQLYGCQPTQDGQPGMCKGLFPAVAAKFPHCSFGMYGEVNNNASCSLKVHLTLTLT